MNFEEIGWKDMDWIDMAYDWDTRHGPANRAMKLRHNKLREMSGPAVKRLALQ